jgi:hypothetical protein
MVEGTTPSQQSGQRGLANLAKFCRAEDRLECGRVLRQKLERELRGPRAAGVAGIVSGGEMLRLLHAHTVRGRTRIAHVKYKDFIKSLFKRLAASGAEEAQRDAEGQASGAGAAAPGSLDNLASAPGLAPAEAYAAAAPGEHGTSHWLSHLPDHTAASVRSGRATGGGAPAGGAYNPVTHCWGPPGSPEPAAKAAAAKHRAPLSAASYNIITNADDPSRRARKGRPESRKRVMSASYQSTTALFQAAESGAPAGSSPGKSAAARPAGRYDPICGSWLELPADASRLVREADLATGKLQLKASNRPSLEPFGRYNLIQQRWTETPLDSKYETREDLIPGLFKRRPLSAMASWY